MKRVRERSLDEIHIKEETENSDVSTLMVVFENQEGKYT